MVENNIGKTRIIDVIENQLLYKTVHENTFAIARIMRSALKCDFFTDDFYEVLF